MKPLHATEQRALVLGRTYRAQPSPHNTHTCAGCAANHPHLLASERNTLCRAMPSCFAAGRSDGRNVIWIPEEATP